MKLEEMAKMPLTSLPTSFYKMANLTNFLGGPDVYIKRDDVMDLAHGGNKTRKLEYVFADALSKGADCVITMGGIQSNHVRQTISGAARLGLKSHAILNIPVPEMRDAFAASGNYLMDVIEYCRYERQQRKIGIKSSLFFMRWATKEIHTLIIPIRRKKKHF